ncbi:uncharacterized protein BX663DRAFT_544832 [Cokeromyces recurvatus]|uniref:uncharacterized protein n=1 Tax=Cokeromyces recurvatus TaxID=90255 RepID=UPI002220ADFA|nr:uncharacterized protein BX663DRAFT_544832 [Cokeromyces recurvatus]KAI7900689.1 hypothetical protein BX663DRAFT_544832 [Cokeromyces recurvatus]
MHKNESDIFISGSEISSLYAAIVLSKIGLTVYMIDNNNRKDDTNELLLLSPRSLQLLNQIDLLEPLFKQGGMRHWKFEIYQNSQSANVSQQSIRLWNNETTGFNYSVTCKKSVLYNLLKQQLQEIIQIDQNQEIIDINDQSDNHYQLPLLNTTDISSYYQYRPLPCIPRNNKYDITIERAFKSIYLKHTDTHQTKVWKSQIIIGAEGQQSFIRKKLGIPLGRKKSYNNKNMNSIITRIFYTLQITIISANFPGLKQISIVSKDRNIIYVTGRESEIYVIFEHKSSWSKTSIDDEIPAQVALEHIRSILQPYKIEFGSIKSYTRWQGGEQNLCEEFSFDSSYFLIGSSAQMIGLPGIFDINIHLEQIQNLCWKLALNIRRCALSRLLETYDYEAKVIAEEAINTAHLFTNFIGDYYKIKEEEEEEETSLNMSFHNRDLLYQLQKHFKHCFVGDTPFTTSTILNYSNDQQNENDENISHSSKAGLVGCLAPNARLKPYTLFQLLLLSSGQPSTKTTVTTTQLVSMTPSHLLEPPLVSPSPPLQPQEEISNNVNTVKTILQKGIKSGRKRSSSVTSSNNGSIFSIWSLLQKNLKKRSHHQQQDNKILNSNKMSSITTTTPASVLISTERWKSIRTNHLQLHELIRNKHCLPAFTLFIFCGPIGNTHQNKIYQFVRQLVGSSNSFLYRYDDSLLSEEDRYDGCSNNRSFSPNSIHSLSRSNSNRQGRNSISSINMLDKNQRTHKSSLVADNSTTPRSSIDSTRTTTSHYYEHRCSTSSISSLHIQQQSQSSSLFSILFITSSTKNEVIKYLNDTPPAMVHSTFPCGLAKVFLDHDQQCYRIYNVKQPEIVVIRPDGYVGTRLILTPENNAFEQLNMYFDSFLRVPVDMNSAAAVVADNYNF